MKRLYALDGIRGVAAIVVAVHHFAIISGVAGLGPLPGLAVDVFFVLSGFVMARTYEGRLGSAITPTRFLLLRWKRLYVCATIGAGLGLLYSFFAGETPTLVFAFLAAVFFLPAVWLANPFYLNEPSWTLFHEIIANALHAAVFARLSSRQLLWLAVASTALWAALLPFGFGSAGPDFSLVAVLSVFPRFIALYLIGIVVFRQWGDQPFDATLSLPLQRVCSGLGEISYPLYATHVPALWVATLMDLPPYASALFAVAVMALTSVIDARLRLKRDTVTVSDPSFDGVAV